MKRPKLRLRWLVPLGFLLLPPLFWVLVLAVAPTDWARTRVIGKLAAATGRTVELESLRVGMFGGVRLVGLEIGAPGPAHDPWLKVDEARINVGLVQLVFGQVEPTEIDLSGLYLRILRRGDGSLELADLIPSAAPAGSGSDTRPPDAAPSAPSCRCAALGVELRLHDAQVQVVDEASRTRLDFQKVEGRATWQGHRATIQELRGTLNDGPFELAAHLDCSTPSPTYEGQVRAKDVGLARGMDVLSYLVPVLAGNGASARLEGRMALDLYVRGEGLGRADVRRSLVGHGKLGLDPVRLDASPLLAELASVALVPERGQVGSVKADFAIKAGRILTDDLTVDAAQVPIALAGSTDFDGRLNYRVKTDRLTERIPGKARDLLSELSIDVDRVTDVRVAGTVRALAVTVDGVPLNAAAGDARGQGPGRRGGDRDRVRVLGRRLRDRILR